MLMVYEMTNFLLASRWFVVTFWQILWYFRWQNF